MHAKLRKNRPIRFAPENIMNAILTIFDVLASFFRAMPRGLLSRFEFFGAAHIRP